ncbi:hypothetical protein ACFQZT_11695 [Paenibacillus sp. GCM10027628]|uniref:hypothetical protein n=1 Tax=Paenibacillus sp. GCM10027628 TaxID=3273413 RepID=UPI00362F228B
MNGALGNGNGLGPVVELGVMLLEKNGGEPPDTERSNGPRDDAVDGSFDEFSCR